MSEIENTNERALTKPVLFEMWTRDQIELIRHTIAPGISLPELSLFAMVCKRTGLDPFTKQIYAIKRGDRMTVQTGIDGYRVLAVRTGELAGIDDAIYDTEDSDHPGRASVTVWRLVQGQRVPFTATARWNEYVQNDRNGKPTSMWSKMPYLMLAKCAESLALRKAFPAELSGIYTAEEMAQADNQPDNEGERVVDSPIAPVERKTSAFASAPKPLRPAEPPAAAPVTPPAAPTPIAEDEPATADQQERMRKYRDALNITDKAIAVADNHLRYGAADARIHEYITRWQREQRERQLQPATAQKEAR